MIVYLARSPGAEPAWWHARNEEGDSAQGWTPDAVLHAVGPATKVIREEWRGPPHMGLPSKARWVGR